MKSQAKIALASIVLLYASSLIADESTQAYTLESIDASYEFKDNSIYSEAPLNAKSTNTLNKKTLDTIGGPAQSNYYKALDLLPGVNVQTADSLGVSNGSSIKVRGKSSFHVGRTIEDIPLTGIVGSSGLGGGELFDIENVSEINLYKGAIPSDKGFSLSTSTGVVNANLLQPQNDFGVHIKQSLGIDRFRRTFGRVDSGKIADSSSFYVSYSDLAADKQRGEGKSPDGRQNINFGFKQNINDSIMANIYAAFSKIKLYDYRSMNQAMADDFKDSYDFDYEPEKGSNMWYKYNRQEFESKAIIADIKARLMDDVYLTLKPHYWDEDGYRMFASGANKVIKWDIDHKQYGILSKIDAYVADTALSLGHSYLNMEAPPPPVYRKVYTVDPNGNLTDYKYHTLSKQSNNILNSFFITALKSFDDLTVSGGVKYLVWKSANLQYFTNTNTLSGDLSYGDALSQAIEDPRQKVSSTTFHKVLPNLSFDYKLTKDLSLALQYSKTYGRPDWGPQAQGYQGASAAYKATHTMQDMFDVLKPEMADNFELSASYSTKDFHFKPVAFYSQYKDKELNVYDDIAQQNYLMSNSKAIVYGIEAEMAYSPTSEFSLFCSPSYTISEFSKDTTVSATQTLATKGNQLPDIPKLLIKLGVSYEKNGFYLSPVFRYSDSRYGDPLNTTKVGSYTIADIHTGYTMKNISFAKELSFSASLLNVFNKKYIASISSSDFTLDGATSYMVGAPFSAIFSVSAKF
ncbi:MAG: TonB-dependent receptor [Sulfurimonas sp.]